MDRLLTKTLAEIYIQQGHLQEALSIFQALSQKNPADTELQNSVRELEARLKDLSPRDRPMDPTLEKKKRILEKWLENIRDRRTR